MPEGPSLIYISLKLKPFSGKKVTGCGGYTPMATGWIKGEKLLEVCTWGKHLLLRFKKGTVRIHLMLFGSVLINEKKKVNASFFLQFGKDEVNFYVVKAIQLTQPLKDIYDWRTDIMSRKWSSKHIIRLAGEHITEIIGDTLLDQQVFTGVGNIIRNEVLFRTAVHPLSRVGNIPVVKLLELLKDIRVYAKLFLKEKKAGIFGDHFEVHEQKICPRDGNELTIKIIGKTKRKAYFCNSCQEKF
ncbi:MAG: endonuclease [Ferruginibacter sp.]|nr:endonuclease [Ferruginibacter sp.]